MKLQTSREGTKLGLGLLMLVVLCLTTAVAQATYTITDLGTLGGTFSLGAGINNKGWVNGFSYLHGDTQVHAVLWHAGGTLSFFSFV